MGERVREKEEEVGWPLLVASTQYLYFAAGEGFQSASAQTDRGNEMARASVHTQQHGKDDTIRIPCSLLRRASCEHSPLASTVRFVSTFLRVSTVLLNGLVWPSRDNDNSLINRVNGVLVAQGSLMMDKGITSPLNVRASGTAGVGNGMACPRKGMIGCQAAHTPIHTASHHVRIGCTAKTSPAHSALSSSS